MPFERLKNEIASATEGFLSERVLVRGRPLRTEEAIGRPEHADYPIVKGREQILEIEVRGSRGHAFTDGAGFFRGRIRDVLDLQPDTAFNRAMIAGTLNAVLQGTGRIQGSRHCRDEGPVACAGELPAAVEDAYRKWHEVDRIASEFRVLLVGLQPRMAEMLASRYRLRITDLDAANIGTKPSGVVVEGSEVTPEVLRWCDLAVVTGSTLTNGTIGEYLGLEVPSIFYGVTIAGGARVLGLTRFCPRSA
jgi:hypothetical protein